MEGESFVGNLGAKDCIRAFGVGGESSGKTKASEVGEETDMDILSSFGVSVSSEGVLHILAVGDGKDCIIGLGVGCRVALLLLLLRYSCILC